MFEKPIHTLSEISFVPFTMEYGAEVANIYNWYILAGTAAFAHEQVPDDYFSFLLETSATYPVFVLLDTRCGRVAGFCFLSPFHSMPTFRQTATIGYFIASEYTGKGLGALCLERLEEEAKRAGISHIIADISSENHGSIAFHDKHGFTRCGELKNIGNKLDRDFSVVYMQKDI